ncbi:MAG: hypothetical protein D6705_04080 [Deltaproteobacteria bacterium]|nr:MAG: hypothetical protein D6705_04080 [Deltaproteobacteria bacterium]
MQVATHASWVRRAKRLFAVGHPARDLGLASGPARVDVPDEWTCPTSGPARVDLPEGRAHAEGGK